MTNDLKLSPHSKLLVERTDESLHLVYQGMSNHELRAVLVGLWASLPPDDAVEHIEELQHYASVPEARLPGLSALIAQKLGSRWKPAEAKAIKAEPPAPSRRIARAWDRYLRIFLPEHASTRERWDARRAFFAGAAALMDTILGGLSGTMETTERDLALMDEVHVELTQFLADVRRGRA